MKHYTLEFYEAEHHGDVENYKGDIISCGGKILDSDLDEDSETCTITFEVEDKKAFDEKFKETDAFMFLN
jgi:hypothetical protein